MFLHKRKNEEMPICAIPRGLVDAVVAAILPRPAPLVVNPNAKLDVRKGRQSRRHVAARIFWRQGRVSMRFNRIRSTKAVLRGRRNPGVLCFADQCSVPILHARSPPLFLRRGSAPPPDVSTRVTPSRRSISLFFRPSGPGRRKWISRGGGRAPMAIS